MYNYKCSRNEKKMKKSLVDPSYVVVNDLFNDGLHCLEIIDLTSDHLFVKFKQTWLIAYSTGPSCGRYGGQQTTRCPRSRMAS